MGNEQFWRIVSDNNEANVANFTGRINTDEKKLCL